MCSKRDLSQKPVSLLMRARVQLENSSDLPPSADSIISAVIAVVVPNVVIVIVFFVKSCHWCPSSVVLTIDAWEKKYRRTWQVPSARLQPQLRLPKSCIILRLNYVFGLTIRGSSSTVGFQNSPVRSATLPIEVEKVHRDFARTPRFENCNCTFDLSDVYLVNPD